MFYVVNILVPLSLGLIIYLVLRPDSYVSRFLNHYIHLHTNVASFLPEGFQRFLKYYVADILWSYSLCFAIMASLNHSQKELIVGFFICVGFETIIEVLQIPSAFPGTFDPVDILFECLSNAVALSVILFYEEVHHE